MDTWILTWHLFLLHEEIWGWVKTHENPFCSHQHSWDLWMFILLKMVFILSHGHMNSIEHSHLSIGTPWYLTPQVEMTVMMKRSELPLRPVREEVWICFRQATKKNDAEEWFVTILVGFYCSIVFWGFLQWIIAKPLSSFPDFCDSLVTIESSN